MDIVTSEVPVQLYTQLQSKADAEKTDIIELLRRLVVVANGHQAQPQATTRAFQRILDRAADLGVNDLAEQHDHYFVIYHLCYSNFLDDMDDV